MPPENQFKNQEQSQPKSKNLIIWIIFLVVVLAVGGVLIYFLNKEKEIIEPKPLPGTSINGSENDDADDTIGANIDTRDWLTYRNEDFQFAIDIPPDWMVTDNVWMIHIHPQNADFEVSSLASGIPHVSILPAGSGGPGSLLHSGVTKNISISYPAGRQGSMNVPVSWGGCEMRGFIVTENVEDIGDINVQEKILSSFRFTVEDEELVSHGCAVG